MGVLFLSFLRASKKYVWSTDFISKFGFKARSIRVSLSRFSINKNKKALISETGYISDNSVINADFKVLIFIAKL